MDLGMPVMGGCEAIRKIKQEPWSKNMVFIAITGRGTDADIKNTTEAGFHHHMVKPPDPKKLIALIGQTEEAGCSHSPAPTRAPHSEGERALTDGEGE
ncbi:response regulator [Pelagicoccus sp. SDUM812002]|uniref:response regulator n=1 Tax=Pelagicoccus sp. SDUM812002 TaxID=3041266 RepID=UPI00280C998F|nr:response regulator [Pelagicoccus sp. SDUM812002]MDQ8184120.1 response regulator [Pelagicoccus sp. SDUM812002]